MNREILTMFLLGTGGGIKAIRNMYPNLSERNVFDIASIATSENNMHKKLNQKANTVRNALITYLQNMKRMGPRITLYRNYPHISKRYIEKILSNFQTEKNLRAFLNKKKPTYRLRLKKVKRLPPIKPISTKTSFPPKKALNNMKSLLTVLNKKPMNMSKLFNSLPFNNVRVLKREYI